METATEAVGCRRAQAVREAYSLESLRDAMSALHEDCEDCERVLTEAPTFGGAEPAKTYNGVWSWDETRLLIGDDFAIVSREQS